MWRFTNEFPTDKRPDGREPEKFRDILINWNSIGTANGSSIIKLGNTLVVSGITFEKSEIKKKEQSSFEEVIKNLSKESFFEIDIKFKPHSAFILKVDNCDDDIKESLMLTKFFKQLICDSEIFNTKQLIEFENESCFINKMIIEVLIENYDGNSFDAVNIAILSSLIECKLNKKSIEIINYPISTTFCFTSSLDLKKIIVLNDPSLDDERLCSNQLSIFINAETENLILIKKIGGDSLNSEIIKNCIKTACKRANNLKSYLISKKKVISF